MHIHRIPACALNCCYISNFNLTQHTEMSGNGSKHFLAQNPWKVWIMLQTALLNCSCMSSRRQWKLSSNRSIYLCIRYLPLWDLSPFKNTILKNATKSYKLCHWKVGNSMSGLQEKQSREVLYSIIVRGNIFSKTFLSWTGEHSGIKRQISTTCYFFPLMQLQAGANKHFFMKVVLSTFTKLTERKRHFCRQAQQVAVFWEASSEAAGKAW